MKLICLVLLYNFLLSPTFSIISQPGFLDYHRSYIHNKNNLQIYKLDDATVKHIKQYTEDLLHNDVIDSVKNFKFFVNLITSLNNLKYNNKETPSKNLFIIMKYLLMLFKETPTNQVHMLKYMINLFKEYMDTCKDITYNIFENTYNCDLVYEDFCKATNLCEGATKNIIFPHKYIYTTYITESIYNETKINKKQLPLNLIVHYNMNYTNITPFKHILETDFNNTIQNIYKIINIYQLQSFHTLNYSEINYHVYLYDHKAYFQRYINFLLPSLNSEQKYGLNGICYTDNIHKAGCEIHTFIDKNFNKNELINNYKQQLIYNSITYLFNTTYLNKISFMEKHLQTLFDIDVNKYHYILPKTNNIHDVLYNKNNDIKNSYILYNFIKDNSQAKKLMQAIIQAMQQQNININIYIKHFIKKTSEIFKTWYINEQQKTNNTQIIREPFDTAFFYTRFGNYQINCAIPPIYETFHLTQNYIFLNNTRVSYDTIKSLATANPKDITCLTIYPKDIEPLDIYNDIFGYTNFRHMLYKFKPHNYTKQLDPVHVVHMLNLHRIYFPENYNVSKVIPFILQYSQPVEDLIYNTNKLVYKDLLIDTNKSAFPRDNEAYQKKIKQTLKSISLKNLILEMRKRLQYLLQLI